MRTLWIGLAVLIVLVVGADIGGRAYAESKAAQAIGAKTGTAPPSVVIHGFSFLVQAIPGHYAHISLSSQDIAAGPIAGIEATIELYDVDFPLADAIRGDTGKLTAANAAVRAVIADTKLTAALPVTGATISAGANGAIRVSTTVTVAGRRIPLGAELRASYTAGVLRLEAVGLSAAGIPVGNLTQLTKDLSLELPLQDLPFTVDAATLTASGTDLILTGTAADSGSVR